MVLMRKTNRQSLSFKAFVDAGGAMLPIIYTVEHTYFQVFVLLLSTYPPLLFQSIIRRHGTAEMVTKQISSYQRSAG